MHPLRATQSSALHTLILFLQINLCLAPVLWPWCSQGYTLTLHFHILLMPRRTPELETSVTRINTFHTTSYPKHHIALILARTLFIFLWLISPLLPVKAENVPSLAFFLTFLSHSLHISSPSFCPLTLSWLSWK